MHNLHVCIIREYVKGPTNYELVWMDDNNHVQTAVISKGTAKKLMAAGMPYEG